VDRDRTRDACHIRTRSLGKLKLVNWRVGELVNSTSRAAGPQTSDSPNHELANSPTPDRLTVGITTRNRLPSLVRCVKSLALLGDLASRVIVVDDASDEPVAGPLAAAFPHLAGTLQVVRRDAGGGYIAARNSIMQLAATEYVLSLDDDAYLIDGEGIGRALALMERHPSVAAVACAQAEADGSPWPAGMQPAKVSYACDVAAFIGFASVIRRSAFFEVGGYREPLHFYGEEKDLSVRLWNAGYRVVYMPDVRVAHVVDPSGRSPSRYVRYAIRNDCLFALYNEPLPVAVVSVPLRLARYFSMSRGHSDPGGFRWIVRDVARLLPSVLRDRRPVSWKGFLHWRHVQRTVPAFPLTETR
jgi:GT2 family glycosyltransferase